jgi:hypothetical protein
MGAGGLEPPEPEGEGFTVPCNCRYATPPQNWKKLLEKGIEPSTVRLQVGCSTFELLQQILHTVITTNLIIHKIFLNFFNFLMGQLCPQEKVFVLHPKKQDLPVD